MLRLFDSAAKADRPDRIEKMIGDLSRLQLGELASKLTPRRVDSRGLDRNQDGIAALPE